MACGAPAPQPRVLVFAAASLKPVLDALTPEVERSLDLQVRVSFAASSALARQIEAGAPADVFVSADRDWMDYIEHAGLLRPGSRVDLVANRLVLVCPAAHPIAIRITPGFGLREALGDGRLAIADPSSVPAGKYGRAALEQLGVWNSVRDRLAPAENVRAALVLVARAEAPLGIVYRSDAVSEPAVRIVDMFPEDSHPPIVFHAAITKRGSGDAALVLQFIQSEAAMRLFERFGFTPVQSR